MVGAPHLQDDLQSVTESLKCLDFSGASACGAFGSCTILNDGVTETCECRDVWTQTEEMSLYFLSQDQIDAGLALCNLNRPLLQTLYVLMLLISVAGLVLQACQITKRKQIRRMAPLLASLSLAIFTALYKLARFDVALIGKDVFFTVLIANLAYLPAFVTVVFSEKYLVVLTLKVPIFQARTLKTFVYFKRFNKWTLLLDVVLYQLFWISLMTGNQQMQGQALFRIALGSVGLRALSLAIIVYLTLTRFIKDMQRILDDFYTQNAEKDAPVINPAKKLQTQIQSLLIPQTKLFRALCNGSLGSIAVGFTCAAAFPLLAYNTGYIMPMYHITWQVANMTMLVSKARKIRPTTSGTGKTAVDQSQTFTREIEEGSTSRKTGEQAAKTFAPESL